MNGKLGLPLLLLACIVAAGCKGSSPAAVAAKPPDVTVAYPVEQSITDTEEFPGRIDAVNTVQVKARVQGYLKEVDFIDGQEVRKDDLLAVIQQEPYEYHLKAARAQLALSEAALGLAKVVLRRAQEAKSGATGLEIDQDNAQVEQATANVSLAKANLETAELNMGYTLVRAPLSGRLSRRMGDPGNIVLSDTSGGANAPVTTTLMSLDPVYVYFDIDERTMLRLERLSPDKKPPVPWKMVVRSRSDKVAAQGNPDPLDARPGVPA